MRLIQRKHSLLFKPKIVIFVERFTESENLNQFCSQVIFCHHSLVVILTILGVLYNSQPGLCISKLFFSKTKTMNDLLEMILTQINRLPENVARKVNSQDLDHSSETNWFHCDTRMRCDFCMFSKDVAKVLICNIAQQANVTRTKWIFIYYTGHLLLPRSTVVQITISVTASLFAHKQ